MKDFPLREWKFWITTAISLIVVMAITNFLDPHNFPTAFPEALVAWGTLTLALATFLLVQVTRKEHIEHGRRENMTEILEWAIDVGAYMVGRNLPPFKKHVIYAYGEYFKQAIEAKVIARYTDFRMRSVYILEVSRSIPELEILVPKAVEYLRLQLRLLNKYREKYNIPAHPNFIVKASDNIASNEDRLYKSIVDIIENIGKTRSL